MIPTYSGKMIPLQQIATIEESNAPSRIFRESQERFVSIGCDLGKDIDLSSAVRKIEGIIKQTSIPSDFQVVIG